ncbi:MAG: hypothetical protein WBC70_16080 [Candidatus Aminicenantales bacterium]
MDSVVLDAIETRLKFENSSIKFRGTEWNHLPVRVFDASCGVAWPSLDDTLCPLLSFT